MIAAVLSICLLAMPDQCVTQHFRVEPAACRLRPYRAEAPAGSEWKPVLIRLVCEHR